MRKAPFPGSHTFLYKQFRANYQQQKNFRITIETQAKNLFPSLCFSLCEK